MEDNKIIVEDENGNELTFEILFTFDNDETGAKYVLYFDPKDPEASVFASRYEDDGTLNEIETAEEWDMVEEVFQSFLAEDDEEEEVSEEEPVFEVCEDNSCDE